MLHKQCSTCFQCTVLTSLRGRGGGGASVNGGCRSHIHCVSDMFLKLG